MRGKNLYMMVSWLEIEFESVKALVKNLNGDAQSPHI